MLGRHDVKLLVTWTPNSKYINLILSIARKSIVFASSMPTSVIQNASSFKLSCFNLNFNETYSGIHDQIISSATAKW